MLGVYPSMGIARRHTYLLLKEKILADMVAVTIEITGLELQPDSWGAGGDLGGTASYPLPPLSSAAISSQEEDRKQRRTMYVTRK